jgi:hypothetical protein
MVVLANPGKIAQQAAYARAHGLEATAEALEDALSRAGRCQDCGRALTDAASVEAGRGPVCSAKAKGVQVAPANPLVVGKVGLPRVGEG